jgi:putative copper export protein
VLPDVLSVVARALCFVCALQAAGIAMFLVLFDIAALAVRDGIQRLGRRLGLAAGVLVLVHYGLEPARMAGELSGIWDPSLQKLAATSGVAIAAALRIVGLVFVVAALSASRGAGGSAPYSASLRAAAWIGALLVAASFAATGHTAAATHRSVLAGLLLTHLLVIEFWFGALAPLIVITRHAPQAAALTIRRFSILATRVVPLILIAGIAMAWILIPSVQVFQEPYGALLLAKGAGFAALLALASLNKWKLAPALQIGDVVAARTFQRSAAAEYVLIVIVLAVTAVMTSFFSPEA